MSGFSWDEWDKRVVVYSGQRAGKTLELKRRAERSMHRHHASNTWASMGPDVCCTCTRIVDTCACHTRGEN